MSRIIDAETSSLSGLSAGQTVEGFRYVSLEQLAEIDGVAHVLRHDKTGARLLYLENDDENKGFAIAFKTPPEDSTGAFHILEHSVLCGSERFPVKEPFVDLLKTSMQTFLNAMTFPDKTMYPVASTNEKDLLNLMDVYLDAVLHPAIYSKRAIFEQEGWHYEIDDSDGSLRYNGVVYNEMKGALSDPDDVLYHAMNAALLPDTCYAFESGGHPRCIPQLTYEGFLEAHARHYRLDNAYVVLYGDMDIHRILAFLDARFQEAKTPDHQLAPVSAIALQPPLKAGHVRVPMATSPDNACVGLGYVIGTAADFERVLAVDILLDALMGGNESPVKRALLDAGIAGDATAYLVDSQLQPVAMFQLRSARPGAAEKLREIVEEQAARLVDEGIPRDLLEASLAQAAFSLRERDRGIADGVALAMNSLAGWLYDDDAPTTYLRFEEPLAHLKAGLETGLFEDVLRSLVLESGHNALVEIVPEDNEDSWEAAEFARVEGLMDETDFDRIRQDVESLRELQESPDSPEALATLPRLRVSDIGEAKPEPEFEMVAGTPLPCGYHGLSTRGIDYATMYFDLSHLTWEDIPYVSIAASVLSQLDTQVRSAAELDIHMRSHLGMLRFFPEVMSSDADPSDVALKLVVASSALSEDLEHLVEIPQEVWSKTVFSDPGKILDILQQRRVGMEQSFIGEGHARAINRVLSYHAPSGVLRETLGGVDFYVFLKDLIDDFDQRGEGLCAKLAEVTAAMFTSQVTVSFTGPRADLDRFWQLAGDFGLPEAPAEKRLAIPAPRPRNEAFIVPTDVCFVACGASGFDVGCTYSGIWPVVSRALSFDYLWNEVRVKGGAYGTGFRITPTNALSLHSFRDPGVDDTLRRFAGAGDWLACFEPAAEEMEGYIVSTVAAHDAPAKPRQIARRQDTDFLRGCPAGRRERMRAEELAATVESVRACAPVLKGMAEHSCVCVFGNADAIKAAKTELEIVELMA